LSADLKLWLAGIFSDPKIWPPGKTGQPEYYTSNLVRKSEIFSDPKIWPPGKAGQPEYYTSKKTLRLPLAERSDAFP
jgi:hypothetical protein